MDRTGRLFGLHEREILKDHGSYFVIKETWVPRKYGTLLVFDPNKMVVEKMVMEPQAPVQTQVNV